MSRHGHHKAMRETTGRVVSDYMKQWMERNKATWSQRQGRLKELEEVGRRLVADDPSLASHPLLPERMAAMMQLRAQGATLRVVGESVELSAEYTRQILAQGYKALAILHQETLLP